MEQSMREQLQALVKFWNKRADELSCDGNHGEARALRTRISELEATISTSPPAASVKAGWVTVTERMPGVLLDVFTWDGNAYHIAYRREGAWIRSDGFFLRNVTHWHAIEYPQPPEPQP